MNEDMPAKMAVQENDEVLFMWFECKGLKTRVERENGKRPGKPPPHKRHRMARRERLARSAAARAGKPAGIHRRRLQMVIGVHTDRSLVRIHLNI
jgi:hypothetical protein